MELVDKETKKPYMEPAYLELIKADQDQNRIRATNLPILNAEARNNIAECSKYSGYFSNPITTAFMKKYILSKIEFPTTLACLAQSITELNVRTDNIASDAYTHQKTKLEIEEFQIKVDEFQAKFDSFHTLESSIESRKFGNELKKAQLEVANKVMALNKIELGAMARYKEAMGWKQCVEDFMKEGGYKSLDEVPWDDIRMGEMSAKVKKWGELAATNQLEMTPSKFNVIQDSQEDFGMGYHEGKQRIELLMQIEHNQKQAQELEIKKQLMISEISSAKFKAVEPEVEQAKQ